MNFTITWRTALIFVAGLVLAGVVGAAFDSEYAGLPVLLATVAYLANSEKNRRP